MTTAHLTALFGIATLLVGAGIAATAIFAHLGPALEQAAPALKVLGIL